MRPRRQVLRFGLGGLGGLAGLEAFSGPGPQAGTASPGSSGTAATPPTADAVRPGRALRFPHDHGAHPGTAIEWWYLTGWLGRFDAPRWGLQVTFFRRRTGLAEGHPSRQAARQLLFAHAALTDLATRQHHHAQRLMRWDGQSRSPWARCASETTDLAVQRWQMTRPAAAASTVVARIDGSFNLELTLDASAPPLLQGDAGFSRKGPGDHHASHYYSQPQLPLQATVVHAGRRETTTGLGWLDHEWSDALMPPDAVGWDWIGMNLADGAALTAFRLRRADGSAVWAGGSHRTADGRLRVFSPAEVRFEARRRWTSGSSGASWPVRWAVQTPAGVYTVDALLDGQEMDHRGSTGLLYWEGLSALHDAAGRRVGLGYLEMTGYGQALRLG